MGHGLDHIRPGDEHVGTVAHHEDEIGHGRGINRAARARPHDERYLWDNARGQHVAGKHIGITGERGHAFLNARTAGIVDANHRRAHAHGLVHDLGNFLGMGLGQGASENGKILAKHENQAAVDGAIACDHAVAGNGLFVHAKIDAAMLHEHVPFLEGIGIEKYIDAFPRCELAFLVLGVHPLLAAARPRTFAFFFQLLENILHLGLRMDGVKKRNPQRPRRKKVHWRL